MNCFHLPYKHALIGLLVCLCVPTVFANDTNTIVTSLSAGPAWQGNGETQTFYLTPEIEKTYSANRSNQTFVVSELFVGMQKAISAQWLGQLGVMAGTSSHATLQGTIWDDADAQFENYRYQYKVQHSQIALMGKLLLNKYDRWMPWVSASVGVGFNRAYGFTNTPLIYEAIPNENFTNQTTTAFTYTVGVGIQRVLNPHWQVGAGYEFSDWGKSQLGSAEGQTLNSGLSLNHLYISSVLINLTYIT